MVMPFQDPNSPLYQGPPPVQYGGGNNEIDDPNSPFYNPSGGQMGNVYQPPTAPQNPTVPGRPLNPPPPGTPQIPGVTTSPVNPPNSYQPINPGTNQSGEPLDPESQRFAQLQQSFANTPFAQSPGLQAVLTQLQGHLPDDQSLTQWTNFIQGLGQKFAQQYSNAAGGAQPTAQQYDTFFQNVVVPMQIGNSNASVQQIGAWNSQADNAIPQLLNSTFSTDIQNANTQRLQGLANTATAPGSAFDVWQNAYKANISDVTNQLQDYQQKLFQKLQPNLMTSLASKGLLDTGALNKAFAGAATDLGTAAQGYVGGITAQANQDIANQRYNIQNAPNASAINNWSAQVPNLSQAGQTALGEAFNYDTSLNAANLSNIWNQNLLNQQYANQPSPLSQAGGLLLGGFAGGAGKGAAGALFS